LEPLKSGDLIWKLNDAENGRKGAAAGLVNDMLEIAEVGLILEIVFVIQFSLLTCEFLYIFELIPLTHLP